MTETVNSEAEIKQDPTYIPEINELPGPDIQEIYTPKNSAEEEIIVGSSSKGHKHETRKRKTKIVN
jgi:hypothetical protein